MVRIIFEKGAAIARALGLVVLVFVYPLFACGTSDLN